MKSLDRANFVSYEIDEIDESPVSTRDYTLSYAVIALNYQKVAENTKRPNQKNPKTSKDLTENIKNFNLGNID